MRPEDDGSLASVASTGSLASVGAIGRIGVVGGIPVGRITFRIARALVARRLHRYRRR